MNGTNNRMSWSARLLIALSLIIVGAAAAVWALSHYDKAAQFLGVATLKPEPVPRPALTAPQPPSQVQVPAVDGRIAQLENRIARVEQSTQRAEGSVGRADALVVAFAARRAIDRGVALGYLEPLLVQRFGPQHQRAVATVVTASRDPVRLDSLIADYRALGPSLRGGGPEEGWWDGFRRELGSIVSFHRADTPSPQPQARYERALARLEAGEVDAALAETMRLPGATNAAQWVGRARRYIAAHRALDEIESAALLGNPAPAISAPQPR